jgi:protein phosphatase
MLICPHCKFENPDANKFCQNCGTSLTHQVCPKCATNVAVNAQYCHNCGTECGTLWRAIIATKQAKPTDGTEDIQELSSPRVISVSLSVGSYLDLEQRYQLVEPPPSIKKTTDQTDVCVRVLDCQPYQVSYLTSLTDNQDQKSVALSENTEKIPRLAKPYIDLQAYSHLGIPLVHDAWHQGDMEVVLIEDRSHWQHLLELWRSDTTSSLQIVHCFYQMTQLWEILETVSCRQSLLEWSNLKLDEDQAVALERLYVEPLKKNYEQAIYATSCQLSEEIETQTSAAQDQLITIKALGRIWQTLFKHSQRTQFGAILQLLGDVELGKIQTLTELQSSLQAIAIELQGNAVNELNTSPVIDGGTAAPTFLQLDEKENTVSRSDDTPTVVLPMQLVSLEQAGLTDVGRQRDHNEDCFGIETQISRVESPHSRTVHARGLFILCDGMGGHAGGEVASASAVNSIRQYFQTHWVDNQLPTEEIIREAVRQANQAIYDINQQDARSGVGRMGTTLVVLLIQDTQVAVAHVGDSRLYRLTRKHQLEQITTDHEVGQREMSRGVDRSVAYSRPDAYQLTQALGPRDENFIAPDVQFFEIHEDTLFLIVSDGLSDNDLLENHWRTHLEPLLNSAANLEIGVSNLIDLANNYNGHDNITAIAIRVKVRPNVEQQ